MVMKLQAFTICKTSRKAKTKILHTTSLDFLFAAAAVAAPVPLAATPWPLTTEPAPLPAAPGPWPAPGTRPRPVPQPSPAAWPWAPPVTLLAVGALGADLAGGMNGVRPPEEEGAEAMAPWIPCEIE